MIARRIATATLFMAVLIFSAASLRAAPDVSALLSAAQRQFNTGNYNNAISTLQSAAAQAPSNGEVCYWLGRNYYELRDYDNAIANAEKSVSLDPKNSLYHQWLGQAYGGKADREHSFFFAKKVKQAFEDAVRLNPSNIEARRDLEEYDLDAPWIVGGNKDEAKAQVDAVAALDPVQGHLARAVLLASQSKKPDQAEAEYRQALAAKPSQIEPYLEVAGFYQKQNNSAGIDAAIAAAAQVNSSDPRLNFFRGVSLVIAGANPTQAEQDLKSYIASTPQRSDWPSHGSARDWLGRLYEAQGKRAEAAEQYRAALQVEPDLKDARNRLDHLEKNAK
ncbi:MAG: tetratricopeptide repeat protein [Candidatus Acidiferrales bacterium]